MDKFIKTSDRNTYDELVALGFECLFFNGETWTFMNKPMLHFDDTNKKVAYSNILEM